MLKELLKVANRLDSLGLTKEADTIDAFIRKIADANVPPMAEGGTGGTGRTETNKEPANKNPAEILGVSNVQDVQSELISIQNALNNPQDLILGVNKDQTAIKAHESLMLVITQAIVEGIDFATQLSDVRESAADWVAWMNKGGRTPDPKSRKIYNFLTAAAGRLSAGKPVFDFKTSTLDVFENTELKLQDAKWVSYIAKDSRRAAIRDAWSNLSGGEDLSFDNYVLWWKSNKEDGKFSDGNAGGIAATIKRLKEESA
jgi:hypothetical protein